MSSAPHAIRIESQRLTLRPFQPADAPEAFDCISARLARYMSWEPSPDLEHFESVWQTWLTQMTNGTDYVFTVRLHDGDAFLGLAGLHRTTDEYPELGIWIRESQHGNGFGTEAVRAVADWGARVLGIRGYVYPVATENTPSRRIAESLGGVVIDARTTPKYALVIYRIPVAPH
ncbi:GNAT family N-acetyltransferase [Pandoraea pulmonicola]|uniref:GNAT family N-acetyltransferase n=1 Tax=Pandoraea pulmonicola TaxID=93221 RepID=A0AAJ4ZD10_PANPU|nr:GNAT family N-acetyltransferase [Pandoraea pulmonicola]AJC20533.1 GNAT family N-acetyltransferase [Pandoraea pulmonicola]SUA91030.1 Uncharacterised protein [Pandoraea pulmonicola]